MASYSWPPTGGNGNIYPTFSAFPAASSVPAGTLAVAADSGILYESNGTTWSILGSPTTVTTVGALDGEAANAKGATINGNTFYQQSATGTYPGLVNNTAQTFSGVKTFSSAPNLSSLSASEAVVTDASNNLTSMVYTNLNTGSTIMSRDSNGNVSANGFMPGYATQATASSTTTLSLASAQLQYFTGTLGQTCILPVTSTLVLGASYTIVNNSIGAVTVQSSGANTIQVMAANTQLVVTVVNTTVTTAAGWSASYSLEAPGTVTSIGMTVPTFLSVTPSSITSNGTFALSLSGTALPTGSGGTGQTSLNSTVFTTLFETIATTLGDLVYGGASGAPTRLAGNTTSTREFLTSAGAASVATAPIWSALASGDIPNNGANTTGTATYATNIAGGAGGSIPYQTAVNATSLLANGTSGQVLTSQGTTLAPIWSAVTPTFSGLNQYGAIYASSTTALASTGAGTTGNVLISGNSGAPSFSATPTLAGIKNTSNVLNIEDSTDATKIIAFNASGNATGKTLTISSAQSASETLSIPNIAGADTLATLGLAQTFSLVQTFTDAPTFSSVTASQLLSVNGSKSLTSIAFATAPAASTISEWDANKNLSANNLIDGFTTTATAAGTTTMTIASTGTQIWTGTTTQTVKLPTTSIVAGGQYTIINSSTGLVTVQSSGANTILTLAANSQGVFTALVATPTTAANWNYAYSAANNAAGTIFVAPTVQTFTSSSGTYTTPTSPRVPLYIQVEMVGGGGGGSAGTTAENGQAGSAGGNTTFGTSLLSAVGGSGGNNGGNGGAGGTASLGAAIGIALTGGTGESSNILITTSQQIPGGSGAGSPFGGAGSGNLSGTGNAGITNTGSGGGGGAIAGGTTGYNGSGGGAGGYIKAIIGSPTTSYSYAVGAGGAGGTTGTNPVAGAAGGSGLIIVTEFYQ